MDAHPPPSDNVQTVLHIDNIHCQSCVDSINAIMHHLEKPQQIISHVDISIPNRSLTFTHPQSLSIQTILKQLDLAGYNASIDSASLFSSSAPLTRTSPWSWLPSFRRTKSKQRESIHKEMCKACRNADSAVTIVQPTPTKTQLLQESRFAIQGIPSSSCTSTISNALPPSPDIGIHSCQVTLVPPSAVVIHAPNLITAQNIQQIIADVGYESEVISSIPLSNKPHPTPSEDNEPNPTSYKAIFSIIGMTCVSCVSSVSGAIQSVPGTTSASVDLMGKTGSVILQRKEDAELVRTEIEDVGFECAIVEIIEQYDAAASNAPKTRVITLKIDGMFCEECVKKVTGTLQDISQTLALTFTPVSLHDSTTTITYLPKPPAFTLRHIRDEIESLGFTLSVVHADSIEERAARARLRERRRILFLFSVTFLFAIPTFIIAVVGMSLLRTNNRFRATLESPLWGNASRGTVALFALATPVQFGVGSFFYKGSWKSLKGVWRKRRAGSDWRRVWIERMFRWGSMDTLVALGTSTGYFASLALMILDIKTKPREGMMGGEMGWFDSSVFLMLFILAGRYLESLSKQRTGDAISTLSSTRPTTGLLYTPGVSSTQPELVDFLEVGDTIIVPVGSSPPLDGILTSSNPPTTFNESSLTGESRPVLKSPNDAIFSGTTNAGPAAATIQITHESGKTMLDGIVGVVREAMSKKAGIERIADVVTGYFVPFVVGISVITFGVWCLRGYLGGLPSDWIVRGDGQSTGGWALFAIQFGVAVLVVACPCGIGLAAPTAQLVGLGLAAQNGVLSNGGGEAFQTITSMNTVVFDKTGTLTTGKFTVSSHRILVDGPSSRDFVCAILLAAEYASTHPLAIGVREWCQAQIDAGEVKSVSVDLVSSEEIPGRGLTATLVVEGIKVEVAIGNQKLMEDVNAEYESDQVSSQAKADLLRWQTLGQSVILLSAKIVQELSGSLNLPINTSRHTMLSLYGVHDPARPEAPTLIAELQRLGMDVWMISGDNPITARSVAGSIGITDSNVIAGALPVDKQKWVQTLQSRPRARRRRVVKMDNNKGSSSWWWRWWWNLRLLHHYSGSERSVVAFIGDGINDAPALAQADVSLALGTGSSVALSTASFHILTPSLLALLMTYHLARATRRKIVSNFVWACVYNVCLIPLAAGAFYAVGGRRTKLPPVWGSAAMALSSVSVVMNSLFLRWLYRAPKVVRDWKAKGGEV